MGTRALAFLLVLAASPRLALAQTTALTVSDPTINRSECLGTGTLTVTFTTSFTGTLPANSEYRLFAQTGSCGSSLPSGTPLSTKPATTTGTQTIATDVDAVRQAIGVVATCDSPDDVPYSLCVYLMDTSGGSGGNVLGTASGGNQMFQLAVPPPPVITRVGPANAALDVYVVQGTVTSTEKASGSGITFVTSASATGQTTVTSGRENGPQIRLNGLTNNVTYTVVAYAYSSGGNESAVSASATGTPLPFEDFWSQYQNAGGQEQGGCGGGAGALSLLSLLPLALRRRRP